MVTCILQKHKELYIYISEGLWILWVPLTDFWWRTLTTQNFMSFLSMFIKEVSQLSLPLVLPHKCILYSAARIIYLKWKSACNIWASSYHVGCFPLFVCYPSFLPHPFSFPAYKYFSWCACYRPETISIIFTLFISKYCIIFTYY